VTVVIFLLADDPELGTFPMRSAAWGLAAAAGGLRHSNGLSIRYLETAVTADAASRPEVTRAGDAIGAGAGSGAGSGSGVVVRQTGPPVTWGVEFDRRGGRRRK
jgi:hypothetical protein